MKILIDKVIYNGLSILVNKNHKSTPVVELKDESSGCFVCDVGDGYLIVATVCCCDDEGYPL